MNTKQTPPFPLRMPKELREWFDAAAKGNKRSLNAELVQCLEELQAKRHQSNQMPGNGEIQEGVIEEIKS